MNDRWIQLEKESDLILLPRNEYDASVTDCILVSSTRSNCLHKIWLMYFDFTDGYFHFPLYDQKWKDIKLEPFFVINRWRLLPNPPSPFLIAELHG